MMKLLTRSILRPLLQGQQGPYVSIYMPVHRAGQETRQNILRLKNLLLRGEDLLKARGMSPEMARGFTAPIHELLDPWNPLWKLRTEWLAVFRSHTSFQYHRLPIAPEEVAIVSARDFYVKPLLPVVLRDGVFYVLALSRARVRLLQCTRGSSQPVELNAPASLEEFMRFSDLEQNFEYDSSAGTVGRGGRAFFNQRAGVDAAVIKADVVEFLKAVERGIEEQMNGGDSPMVLAGVDYMCGSFREISKYSHIMEERIDGNPDGLSDDDLQQAAYQMVEPEFDHGLQQSLTVVQQLAVRQPKRLVFKINDVMKQAYMGHIQTLLVNRLGHEWGRFTPETGETVVHEREEPEDEDLINLAAVHTLLHGGDVYPHEAANMPRGTGAVAVLRY